MSSQDIEKVSLLSQNTMDSYLNHRSVWGGGEGGSGPGVENTPFIMYGDGYSDIGQVTSPGWWYMGWYMCTCAVIVLDFTHWKELQSSDGLKGHYHCRLFTCIM